MPSIVFSTSDFVLKILQFNIQITTDCFAFLDSSITINASRAPVKGWKQLFNPNVGIDRKTFHTAWTCLDDLYRNVTL